MRYLTLLALSLSVLLVGTTCLPLFDLDPDDDSAVGTTLAVSVITPAEDRQIPMVTSETALRVVTIEWTAANLTGSTAIATVFVRARDTLADTIVVGGQRLLQSTATQSVTWDTRGFPGGEYSIHVRVEADSQTEEATADGRITINTPPTFEFTEPTEDTELVERDPNDPNAAPLPAEVTVGWTAYDPDEDGTAEIGIDPDRDHESGNEITILQTDLPRTSGSDSIDWEGTDTSGERVEANTYYLFAVVWDEVNDEQIIQGPTARITVPEEEEFELAFTQPDEDVDFLDPNDGSGDPLEIAFTLDEDEDVTIDFRIDPDDNHDNGNEITINSRHLVEAGTNEDSFEWEGDDSDGNDVADGIYSLFMAVNRGTGTPQIVEAGGLILLRNDEDKWLIRLIAPATDVTFQKGGGGNVLIQWEDDDPNDGDESAKIRLMIDDDEDLIEEDETGQDPEDIPAAGWDDDLLAEPDGALDSLTFFIRDDMEAGRYWIFAIIDRDEVAPFDDEAVAAGQIVIEDPDAE